MDSDPPRVAGAREQHLSPGSLLGAEGRDAQDRCRWGGSQLSPTAPQVTLPNRSPG